MNNHFKNNEDIVKVIIRTLEDKKAEDIHLIYIGEISTIADYFIVTNGNNKSQVQALADNVEEKLAQIGLYPKNIEGYNSANWILLDYQDILVHIFDKDNRAYYDLEHIWRDGKSVDIE